MTPPSHGELVKVGRLEIRPREGLALADGRALVLSVREFELLVALAEHAGHVLSREDLYRLAWGGTLRPGDLGCAISVGRPTRSVSTRRAARRGRAGALDPWWREEGGCAALWLPLRQPLLESQHVPCLVPRTQRPAQCRQQSRSIKRLVQQGAVTRQLVAARGGP